MCKIEKPTLLIKIARYQLTFLGQPALEKTVVDQLAGVCLKVLIFLENSDLEDG